MNIFNKGEFISITSAFKQSGLNLLCELSGLQDNFEALAGGDTDTTINAVRDSIVASWLGFDLLNVKKHGFDAKNSKEDTYLEIKQCSIISKRWGGTWNDTNEEKAKAFMNPKLFTAVAVWKGASDLQFIVFGQSEELGKYLLERVRERKFRSRSTQTVSITRLVEWGFEVVCLPGGKKDHIYKQLCLHNRKFINLINKDSISDV